MTDDRKSATRSTIDSAQRTESDLANRRMGDNKLQGDDQVKVRNQRHAVPDVDTRTEGVVESFENMDPETRARRKDPKNKQNPSE
ncbi:MAG: hypothetical protein K5872_16285 [Rhizobiaceae bacterium]|nr:hypothetical protein [Rhizobiaceae bacterium]MCV0407780.1 hypothetical protein [Rhizobiaceae bacterium]